MFMQRSWLLDLLRHKEMKIKLTDDERKLLIQTVETSTYTGKLAYLVVSILSKLAVEEFAE